MFENFNELFICAYITFKFLLCLVILLVVPLLLRIRMYVRTNDDILHTAALNIFEIQAASVNLLSIYLTVTTYAMLYYSY